MEVSGQLHARAASPADNQLPALLEQEAWWSPRLYGRFGEQKKLLPLSGTKH
jgi:hypothetical protein